MIKKIILPFLFITLFLGACQKKSRDFVYLEQELINIGYVGKYEKPSGTLQKTALGLLGVDDLLAFNGEKEKFIILQLKPNAEKDVASRIETLLGFVESYLSEDDKKELYDSRKKLDKNSIIHSNIMLIWDDEKPDDVVRIIKRNF